jgi:hypothetical protein
LGRVKQERDELPLQRWLSLLLHRKTAACFTQEHCTPLPSLWSMQLGCLITALSQTCSCKLDSTASTRHLVEGQVDGPLIREKTRNHLWTSIGRRSLDFRHMNAFCQRGVMNLLHHGRIYVSSKASKIAKAGVVRPLRLLSQSLYIRVSARCGETRARQFTSRATRALASCSNPNALGGCGAIALCQVCGDKDPW